MIIWNPNGRLDLSSDASDLPEQVNGNNIYSEAMVRCKNLRIDQAGKIITRDGSSKYNSSALAQTGVWRIIEQGGTRYTFAGTSIYANEVSIKTGMTDAAWNGISYNSYNDTTQNIFALNGTNRKRIEGSSVYEWGIEAPTTASTIQVGAASGLTGTYNAKYTYVRKSGSTVICESNPSDEATTSVYLNNQSLSISPTQPSDSQVTHIRFYRTIDSGSLYYYAGEVAASSPYNYGYTYDFEYTFGYITGVGYKFTTTDSSNDREYVFAWEIDYSRGDLSDEDEESTMSVFFEDFDSNLPDGSLGTQVATNHDRPPLGSYVAGPTYNGVCLIVKDNLLYYSLAKQPEYWPATYYIEVSQPAYPGKCIVFFNGQPYYITINKIYLIQGTSYNTFFPVPMACNTGTQSPDGAIAIQGHGIYHVGNDGIYLWNPNGDQKITQDQLEPLFRGEDINGIPGIDSLSNCWLQQFNNKLYFGYKDDSDTYPQNILVFDLSNKKISYFNYGREIRTVCFDQTNDNLIAGDDAGYIWKLEDLSVSTDGGTAISWDAESKDYTLPTRAHFPRWVKYDIDASDSNCSVTSQLKLDGTALQSHTITGNRNTKRRLVATGNGQRCSMRVYGNGPVTIYSVESE